MGAEPRAAWALALLACASCTGRDIRLGDGRLEPAADVVVDFAEPVPIASLAADEGDDDDPSLSADRLLLYFNSERAGGAGEEDIWSSGRTSVDRPWSAPEPAVELNTDARETGIALSADGLAIWFSSNRGGGVSGLDVYTAVRSARDAVWSPPVRVEELSSDGDDLVSSVTDGGRRIYLARRADADDDYDLYLARRSPGEVSFAAPEPLSPFNTDAEESDAFETHQGSALLFTREADLWRGLIDGANVEPLSALNSESDDRDAWANEPGDYVIFSSDRSGRYLLYESSR